MGNNWVQIPLHFVWATWDRLPLVTEDVEADLYRYIKSVCADDRCEALAIGGMPDHVHLLVMMPSSLAPSDLMKHVKRGSSRRMTELLKPGEWFAWQGNYGVTAVCARDKPKIIAYIAGQKRHHAEGATWPLAEQTEDVPSSALDDP